MVRQRIVAESYAEFVAKLLFHLFEDRMKQTARRTLKITKLLDLHRCVCWSQRMRRLSARNARADGAEGRRRLRLTRLRRRRLVRVRRWCGFGAGHVENAAARPAENAKNDDEG